MLLTQLLSNFQFDGITAEGINYSIKDNHISNISPNNDVSLTVLHNGNITLTFYKDGENIVTKQYYATVTALDLYTFIAEHN
jgi:hypothetical protein